MVSKNVDRMLQAAGGGIGLHGSHIQISLGAAATVSSEIPGGITYDLISDQDFYVCGATTAAATCTTADGYYPANMAIPFTSGDAKFLSVLRRSTNGTVFLVKRENQGAV